jgi:plastocyanin
VPAESKIAAAAIGAGLAFAALGGSAFGGSPGEGSGEPAAGAAATKSVAIRDDVFSPRAVTISRGDKVVWRWKGENDHNVSFRKVPSGAKRPRGSTTKSSGRFARTFSRRGTFHYVCTIHEDLGMRGRVVVH